MSGPSPLRLAAVLGLLVLSLAVGGCTTTGADEQTRSADQQGYVTGDGQLTRIPAEKRRTVPTIAGTGVDGKPVSSADAADQVVVFNVYGSWCPPCQKEAADLQAASEATRGQAQFIGITTKDYDPATVQAFERAHGITYPSIFDPDGKVLLEFAGDFPPTAVPTTLVLDRQHRLAARVLGPTTKATLTGLVADVAAGR